jgi:glycosyltransferase involved in cell wall biosynthesis
MMSIEDIGRFSKPIVWTLHDMWAFSGTEHYIDDELTARWRTGYFAHNRPSNHRGLDVDSWVWHRKRRAWQQPIHIVTPSQWLADCARTSCLMRDWPIHTIPNTLDTEKFSPQDKTMARKKLGLPEDKHLVLFGSPGDEQNLRKGWDILKLALAQLSTRITNVAGVIFGQSKPVDPPQLGLPLYWMGRLNDEVTVALLYSAVDVVVVPSRQDNLPQTGTEAQTCGCPVVAFNTCGLPSVVIHQETGYLAKCFDSDDLAKGIEWVLADTERHARLSHQARERAVQLWSPDVVSKQYINVYEQAITDYKQRVYRADLQ